MLHLFASILGNDYIPPAVFESIFASIKLPKKTKACSERHRKIRGLLTWLGHTGAGPAAGLLSGHTARSAQGGVAGVQNLCSNKMDAID